MLEYTNLSRDNNFEKSLLAVHDGDGALYRFEVRVRLECLRLGSFGSALNAQ